MSGAELPRLDCDVHIEAAVPQVWELVTDIRLPARFSPELQRVAWLDDAERPAVGARFEGHNRHHTGAEWRTVSHVVELVEHRAFAWAVLDEDGLFGEPARHPEQALAHWRFELAPDGDGTRLRQTAALGPGRSGLTLIVERSPEHRDQILSGRQEEWLAGMGSTLRGIKDLAERSR
ncbi:SRPBCC family protein [Streptomyces sp. NPDC053367]|uniref:SRPBCC family protein n=1 Tax=Streptomyces sp. NPDC053367 TaxID=3365700 RepID=UPI0037D4E165